MVGLEMFYYKVQLRMSLPDQQGGQVQTLPIEELVFGRSCQASVLYQVQSLAKAEEEPGLSSDSAVGLKVAAVGAVNLIYNSQPISTFFL